MTDSFFAVCPFCSKNVYIEKNISGGYACPICSQAIGLEYMTANNLIIDVVAENEEYNLAQQYFLNTDFREAGAHFAKALQFNRNNYLADYYERLCNIYENETKDDYNLPQKLVAAIISSITKMQNSQANLSNKLEFVSTLLNQTYILLSGHFNEVYETYEKAEKWDELREKCLNIASEIKGITIIDKELLMVYDESIAKSLISISDLCICACQKIVTPHMLQNSKLDLPTDYEHDKSKNLFTMFNFYATSLDKNYNFNTYKPDYTGNLLYNENVITKLNRYNTENKSNEKKFLSASGSNLSELISGCSVALKYSYYTCFKGLVNVKNDPSRIALVNESISFCLEALKPRISIGEEKKVNININNFEKAAEIAYYLNAFVADFSDYNKRLAADYLNKFYDELGESIKLYFSVVYNNYNKYVNKIKELQNNEFKYYKNFLYQIVCSCALALKEIVSFDQHKLGNRIKILKLGKQVAEEFFLLCDYKIEDIERSVKYKDILDIFNAFDDNIKVLTEK